MLSKPILLRLSAIALSCAALSTSLFTPPAAAQSSSKTYRTFAKTFYREEPVTQYKWEEKEVMETSYKKKFVPVYQTETSEKKCISYRPVKKTSERVERTKQLKPVTVTKYRERETQETAYDTVTEMREEQYVTRRPVTETVMQDKQFTVRKKVTEQSCERKEVTTLKPTMVAETTLTPTNVVVPSLAGRPRAAFLRPGYYTDPVSGLTAYRRRGLHWVAPPAPVVPALVPQTTNRLAYVPQVEQKIEPIEISRFVDQVETRKVPVEVQRMEERVETRKVPVEVRRPRQVTKVERIPYTETTYQEVETVRRIPVIEETMQKVETIEPVERTTARWVEKEEAIETPKIVRKKVAYTTTKRVPYTVMMRVAVDSFGNDIGEPEPVDPALRNKTEISTTTKRPSDEAMQSVLEQNRDKRPASFDVAPYPYPLTPTPASSAGDSYQPTGADAVPTLKGSEMLKNRKNRVRSILVPETTQSFAVRTNMQKLGGPAVKVETGKQEISTAVRKPATEAENPYEGKFLTSETSPQIEQTEQPRGDSWATYSPDLIKRPSKPSMNSTPLLSNSNVPQIDKIERVKRKDPSDIY